mmetsp:Transcript_88666/g.248099  ORF Transcript_88666/g.248099 Transcript_88666/m.248099 type:complete len:216 (+) Transcript_88666:3-650(+)
MFATCCCPLVDRGKTVTIGAVSVIDEYASAEKAAAMDKFIAEHGHGATFAAVLSLDGPGRRLGMIVEQVADEALYIASVDDDDATVVGRYNARAPPDRDLRAGDYIASADGMTGDAAFARLAGQSQVELVIRRPALFTVTVRKNGLPLGFVLQCDKLGSSLYVLDVEDGGAVKAADVDLEPGDRIVSVNGRAGSPVVLNDALESSDVLAMMISRP